ncbi:hypothetical protein Hdeb2414_s1112g00983201 [Helianthus debilis subsp. tardiflorus]
MSSNNKNAYQPSPNPIPTPKPISIRQSNLKSSSTGNNLSVRVLREN